MYEYLTMAEYDLLVINGLVVHHDKTEESDIAIKDGKIARLVPRGGLAGETAKNTIDAQGGMVMVRGTRAFSLGLFTDRDIAGRS